MKTALIILNYNNIEDTINCIESVEQYNTATIKIVVVDNGSNRENVANELGLYLKERYECDFLHLDDASLNKTIENKIVLPYITYIQSSNNDGYAQGNNKGLRLCNCDEEIDYVMILNNDVLFVQDIIPTLVERYKILPNVAIISPILYKRDMKEIDYNCARKNVTFSEIIFENLFHYLIKLTKKHKPFCNRFIISKNDKVLPQIIEIELPSGSCMFIDKRYFASIEFFDPNTFLYYEENILYKKIEKTHKKNYILTDLKCIHLGAMSTSKSPGLFAIRCNNFSCRYYMKTYHGISKISAFLLDLSFKFGYTALCLQKKIKSVNINNNK